MKSRIILLCILIIISTSSGCISNDTSQTDDISNNQKNTGDNMAKENRYAIIETEKGVIKFELYEKRAPITTANFITLAESGFYDGLTFHRVVPGFVIQGGDPLGTGMGGSGKTINLEIHPELRHTKGAVAMARTNDPNSATSQFYITLDPQPALDDNYAVFGQVTEGQDIVEKIKIGDKMLKVRIVSKDEA